MIRQQFFCIDACCVNNGFLGPDFALVEITQGKLDRIFQLSRMVRNLGVYSIAIENDLPDWYAGDPAYIASVLRQASDDAEEFDRIGFIFSHLIEFDVSHCHSRLVVAGSDLFWEAESRTGDLYRTEPVAIKTLAARMNPLMLQALSA